MADDSDGAHRSPEPTFADVLNGFSFDSGRTAKRRRWGRRRDSEEEEAAELAGQAAELAPGHPSGPPESDVWPSEHAQGRGGPRAAEPEPPGVFDSEGSSAAVRPYAWTRGRTRSGLDLQLETLVSTSSRGREQLSLLAFEYRSVAELCERVQSVAEVAALLAVPLGVAKVLLGDMAGQGLVVVHRSTGGSGDAPDLALMERVLSGLRRL
jgi:hypothetical protein